MDDSSPGTAAPLSEVSYGPAVGGAAVCLLICAVALPALASLAIEAAGDIRTPSGGTPWSLYAVLVLGGAIAGSLWTWETWHGKVHDVHLQGQTISGWTRWPARGYRRVRLDRLRSIGWIRISYGRNSRTYTDRVLVRDTDGGSVVLSLSSDVSPNNRVIAMLRGAVRSQPDARISHMARARLAGHDSRLRRWITQYAVIFALTAVVCGVIALPALID